METPIFFFFSDDDRVVNIHYIQQVYFFHASNADITLNDGEEISVDGKEDVAALRKLMKWINEVA